MAPNQPRQYDDDDGRVICDMNVDGMRWYDKKQRREMFSNRKDSQRIPQGEPLTRSQTWRYAFYSMLAGLLVSGIFGLVWIAFTWFCINVWFK